MYELPDDFNEVFLVGCTLETVSISRYVTNLSFSNEKSSNEQAIYITICMKAPIRYTCDGVQYDGDPEEPKTIAGIVVLLQKQIIKVDRIGKASLGLYFESNGYVMLDGDNSPYYEAYTICIPGEDIYVV